MCVLHEGGHVALRVSAVCDVMQFLASFNDEPSFSLPNNSEALIL